VKELVNATDLVKRFGGLTAVDGVSLTVQTGEIVGILGPNGAGKTTALRLIAGILTPTAGEVRVNDVNVHRQPLEAKRRIGFLSGDTQLYQRLTPRELLFYFGRIFEIREPLLSEQVDKLIQQLEITSFASQICRTLSTGQKQRVNIARTFLHQPDLLILDEPTAALDIVSAEFILQIIRRERDAGRGILFSTHLVHEAEFMCDRIYLLYGGKVVENGPLPEILTRSGCHNLREAFLFNIQRNGKSPKHAAT
jgi:sodium transport system ATP-binding protein